MSRWAWFAGRALVAVFCVLTWAYGLIVSVQFAFEQFIRPQLFPWVTHFVIWHHAWYWGAFLVSVATLIPDLLSLRTDRRRAGGWLAAAYVVFFFALGVHLLGSPFLVTLNGGAHAVTVVPGALLPLLWLALIDHLNARFPAAERPRQATAPPRVFAASVATAALVWSAHAALAATRADISGGLAGRLATSMWALALDVAAALAACVVLTLVAVMAATRRRAFEWEYACVVALIAIAITEMVRRLVLPSLAFGDVEAAMGAIPFGIVMAAMWSGWRIRQRRIDRPADTALALLVSVFNGRSIRSLLALCVVPVAAAMAYRAVEQVDWALIMNRQIAALEAVLVFGFFLARFRDHAGAWSNWRLVVAPVAALAALAALPPAGSAVAAATRNPQYQTEIALERLPISDPAAAVVARLWIEQQRPNMDYHRAVTTSSITRSSERIAVPPVTYGSTPIEITTRPPNVFIFLIDSLRRDYLSPYNNAVTFTPNIEALAADSYVFANAFTQYGGTWMSIPAIWTGAPLTRGWGQVFKEMNTFEPLIRAGNYDFLINDYTVEAELSTPRKFLNPGIQSVQTDLCDNVKALQSHIDAQAAPRPLFTFLAPMNVHILNTRAGIRSDPRYAGFYPSYAANLERLDGCFGSFMTYLRERGLYDNSIIIIVSDHGETLGTDGNWGHQFFLFPEDVRVPMIIRVPQHLRSGFTTDLTRLALLADIGPTVLALAGQRVPDLDPPFGAPLFVPADGELQPRRRESYLLMSSYGSTFGLLRRNGKFLYISDLVNWREYAYTLFQEPVGERVPVTETIRRVGQEEIRKRIDKVEALYRPR